ncbi:unnamed protein product [Didymodactylos carnosus]|uniref:Uncharacterized protein n=1 Tax=Didymodactylos carnosus TaxID=1234261 RepID=A0A814RMG0_9BILA|nr:unnamed protein product [Didymodactylos carnosus]CAF3899585.1 unnamed protein product [Didymodactylos carnosus]
MRTEDEKFNALLGRLRRGGCTDADYELLQTRVVGGGEVESLNTIHWAPMLVFHNELRTLLNNLAVASRSLETNEAVVICPSVDTIKSNLIDNRTLRKFVQVLPDNKTDGLPGILPLVKGMPVLLTDNIATELGLSNGSSRTFHSLVYTEPRDEEDKTINEQQSSSSLDPAQPNRFPPNTVTLKYPLYALIEIQKSKIKSDLK